MRAIVGLAVGEGMSVKVPTNDETLLSDPMTGGTILLHH